MLLRKCIGLREAVIQEEFLHAGDVDVHALAYLALLLVDVEAMVEIVAQIHARRGDALAKRILDAEHRIGIARGIFFVVPQEGNEVPRRQITQAHHRRIGRAIKQVVVAVIAESVFQADVLGAGLARPAIGAIGQCPLVIRYGFTAGNLRRTGFR